MSTEHAERDRRAKEIFDRAVELTGPDVRAAYVEGACRGDHELCRRVGELMFNNQEDSFLQSPAAGISPETILVPITERPGDKIAHYKLLERLGEGGCGVVYVAEQTEPVRRRVALKVIKLGMDTKSVVARFEAERQALAMMDHPNIAKVLDAGTTEVGRPYFVMELVRGIRITDYCDQGNLTTKERLDLFIKVCHGIQHAHQKGIIHRDIKPSNILVTLHDGVPVPKVIDFGIAKATEGRLTDATVYTQLHQFIGTPAYMSPEQAEMSGLDIDTRSDIYSLGVLLYELLAGSTPFDAKELMASGIDAMRKTIREKEPVRPSTKLATLKGAERTTTAKRRSAEAPKLINLLRGDLDWIVMKCLEKDRTRRYDTANGLVTDLTRHLTNEPVIARPPSTVYRLQKMMRRNKVAFAAGTAIATALVIGLTASVWQGVRAEREAQRAVAALDELRAAAPAFAEQARGLAARERYAEALEKLTYAAKLRPDAPEYLIAKGDLLQCQFHLAEAATAYRAALALRPDHARAKASAALCDELLAAPSGQSGRLSRESLSKLHLAMQQQQRPAAELMPVVRLLGEEKVLLVALWLSRLQDLPVSAELPLEKRLTVRDDGLLALDLSNTKVADLTLLTEMPVGSLNLSGCKHFTDFSRLRDFRSLTALQLGGTAIRDLAPLRSLSLHELDLADTRIVDLAVLRGMPLKKLNLRNTRVADLAPLANMPLTSFEASGIPATDYSPIAGAPLEVCTIQDSALHDLSFLRGSPVRELSLIGCDAARGYGVLAGLKSLELLILSSGYRGLPEEEFAAIGALRAHPTLKNIGEDRWDNDSRLIQTIQPKVVFWKDWDREQTFVPALRKSGISFSLWKLPAGTYSLQIQDQPLSDLAMLTGTPITDLQLDGCQVTSLVAIRELALRVLSLTRNPVADLSPLRGMPLEQLFLDSTQVEDLAPLTGLPLKELHLDSCATVTNVSALAEILTLEKVTVPRKARNIEMLRKLPKLRMLAFNTTDNSAHVPASTAEEFWKAWPGLSWMRALNEAEMSYDASQDSERMWRVAVYAQHFSDCSIFLGGPIRELTLSGTSVTDLQPLGGLALTKLSLQQTPVTDLSVLQGSTLSGSLRQLNVHGTNVTDFSLLTTCTNLEVLEVANAPLADLSILRGRNLRSVRLNYTRVSDISVLAGMPLTFVSLAGSPVTNLSPLLQCPTLKQLALPAAARDLAALRALPALIELSYGTTTGRRTTQSAVEFWKEFEEPWVRAIIDSSLTVNRQIKLPDGTWELNLQDTSIRDLTILSNAPISILSIGGTAVTNLAPLRGMRLKLLHLFGTKVTDLSPLQGMPIANLNLSGCPVRDLSVLRRMPLTSLRLHGCPEVTNVSALAEIGSLQELTIPKHAESFEFLRDTNRFPSLKRLSFLEDKDRNYRPAQTINEFWADFDFRRTIVEAFGSRKLSKLPDGSWEVDLSGSLITDLSSLTNTPIRSLLLGSTQIEDLSPLRKMPLKKLWLYDTPVRDLSPLRGMELEELHLGDTKVVDLSPLAEMPLSSLRLHRCDGITNVAALAGLATLRELTLPPRATGFEFLRDAQKFPRLRRLSYHEDKESGYRVAQTFAEFWREFEASKIPLSPSKTLP